MALHIDEIAIQLSVDRGARGRRRKRRRRREAGGDDLDRDDDDDDDDDEDDDGFGSDSGADCCDHQAIVADAVRQVLKVLRDREAR